MRLDFHAKGIFYEFLSYCGYKKDFQQVLEQLPLKILMIH